MTFSSRPADGPHFLPANLFTANAGLLVPHASSKASRLDCSDIVEGRALESALSSPLSGLGALWPHFTM